MSADHPPDDALVVVDDAAYSVQAMRASAVSAARKALVNTSIFSQSAPDVHDIIVLAEWILTGIHHPEEGPDGKES